MPIIVQKNQFRNQNIGVVKTSRGAVDAQDSVTKLALQINAEVTKELAVQAERTGKDLASTMTTSNLRTINPATGKPEALNLAPESYGSIASNAFQDSVNSRFESSMENEIKYAAQRASTLHPADPDKYEEAFQNSINAMQKHAQGRYKSFINNVGGMYLASTKNSIRAEQVKVTNQGLAVDLDNQVTSKANDIEAMWVSNSSRVDLESVTVFMEKEIRTARTANIITPAQESVLLGKIDTANIKGSINRIIFNYNGTNKESINSVEALDKLNEYINNPNAQTLQAIDDDEIVFSEEQTDGTTFEMTMRQYAVHVKENKLNKARDSKEVLNWLQTTIQKKKVAEESSKKNDEIETKENQINFKNTVVAKTNELKNKLPISSSSSANNPDFVSLYTDYLTSVVAQNNIDKQGTVVRDGKTSSDITTANLNKLGIDARSQTVIKKMSQVIFKDVTDNGIKTDLLNKTLLFVKNEYQTGMIAKDVNIEGLDANQKAMLIKTLDVMGDQYGSNSFKKEMETFLSSNSALYNKIDVFDEKKSTEEARNNRIANSSKLLKLRKEESVTFNKEGSNIDLSNPEESIKIKKLLNSITNKTKAMFADIENNGTKANYLLADVENYESTLVQSTVSGFLSSVAKNPDQQYTFVVNGKTQMKTISTNDLDYFAYHVENVGNWEKSLVPKELWPLIEYAKDNKNMTVKSMLGQSVKDVKALFVNKTSEIAKQKKSSEVAIAIRNKYDKKDPAIDKVISDNVNVDSVPPDPSGLHWILSPLTTSEDKRWSTTVDFADQHQRLDVGTVSAIEALGKGMFNDNKNIDSALKMFKGLRYYNKEQSDGSFKTVNLLTRLVGNKIDTKALYNIEKAITVSSMSGGSTPSVLKNLTTYNDPSVTKGKQDAFWSQAEFSNTKDNSDYIGFGKNSGGFESLVRQHTNNVFDIKEVAMFAEHYVETSNTDVSYKQLNELIVETLDNLTAVTNNVFDMNSQFNENGEMKSRFAISKKVNPSRIQEFYDGIDVKLPLGQVLAREVTKDLGEISKDVLTFPSLRGGERMNSGQTRLEKDQMNNKVAYLVPATTDPNNTVYNLVNITRNGDQIDYTPVLDPVTNTFMSVNVGPEWQNDSVTSDLDQIDLSEAMITKLNQDIASGQLNNDQTILKTKEIVKHEAIIKSIENESNNKTASNVDGTAFPSDNSNVLENAYVVLNKQEGFNHLQYKDGANFSIGPGLYIPALESDERALIKNIRYITVPEGKAVLKLKISKLRTRWSDLLKNRTENKGEMSNLPVKTRVAMISMAYQLGIHNIASKEKNPKAWPAFMKSITKASTYPLNSPDQKKYLQEASENMLYNFKNGVKDSETGWYKQTPERAEAMARAMLGK